MARATNRLNARKVTTAKKPGRHADGNGLYLIVDKGGAKRWAFIFRHGVTKAGKPAIREMGLGGLARVSLADARLKAVECRRLLADRKNPIEVRKGERQAQAAATANFGDVADELVESLKPGFRNAKHRWQWETTLRKHAAPLRPMRPNEIGTDDILAVLKPLWLTIPETASRLRGRIEHVLDAAAAKGLRSGENPARWRGHLNRLLPPRRKLPQGHHAAMPYRDVPDFMARLRERDGFSARALEWLILTVARTGQALGTRWDEVDRETRMWNVPADRMKQSKPHRVSLTDRTLAILDEMEAYRVGDYVFAGPRYGRPFSTNVFRALLQRMKIEGATPHGFRSAFRDWVAEETSFPSDLAEIAMAHAVGDAVERAYRRGDAFERRRELMAAWDAYCAAGAQATSCGSLAYGRISGR